MLARRAVTYGVLGAATLSVVSWGLRAVGVPIQLELLLGSGLGLQPNADAFFVGLLMHLAIGGAFGLLYGWLFETVWNHGGAGMGMILGVVHAALVGMAVGLTPQFHPMVPSRIEDPGAFFANGGVRGVLAFFAVHVLYGAIVGQGYGHVRSERQWAPLGRP